jgi:hypothetical protein
MRTPAFAALTIASLTLATPAIVAAQPTATAPAPSAPAAAAPAAAAAAVAIPAATAGHYSVEDTDIGALLDDPAAKAVLDRHIPAISQSDQISMARSLTLKGIQQYAPDQVTDAKLAAIQTDLNALPAHP